MIKQKFKNFFTERNTKVAVLLLIGVAIFLFHNPIRLVENSDDTIFLEKAETMNYSDFISERYMTWSSRIGAETAIYFLVTMNLNVWKVINVLMIFLLAYSINRIFKEKVTLFDYVFVLATLALIGQRVLTSSSFAFHGAPNYLWPAATGIFALIPLADLFFRNVKENRPYMKILYGIAILYTVFSNEQVALILLAFTLLFIGYSKFKKNKIPAAIFAYLAIIIASLLVVFLAPGNSIRYEAEIGRWYPDFNEISMKTRMIRNVSWLYGKLFSQQWYLFIVLGIMTAYVYFKRYGKRNYLLEVMISIPFGLVLIKGLKNFDDLLFDFGKKGTIENIWIYLFWSLYMAVILYSLFKVDKRKIFYLLILSAGIFSMLLMWVSPTMYASANRVLLVCSIFLVILINKLRIDSGLEIKKHLLIYSVFPVINMIIIFLDWSKRYTIRY